MVKYCVYKNGARIGEYKTRKAAQMIATKKRGKVIATGYGKRSR